MSQKMGVRLLAGVAIAAVIGLGWVWLHRPQPARATEVPVRLIELSGDIARPSAELSGLAWWRDELVLLPQDPGRQGRVVFVISRASIERYLDDGGDPPEVRRVPFVSPNFAGEPFDGFEAIAIDGDDVFVTVERGVDDGPVGELLRGRVEGDLERIVVERSSVMLEAQNRLENTAYETLVVHGDLVLAIYETNGIVNEDPRSLAFTRDLSPAGTYRMTPLEYRATDATSVDRQGRFWVSNYHWPGAPWQSGTCELTERFGQGESHARCETVERLVELQIEGETISLTPRAPILLALIDDDHPRNWEGVVRLGDRGFLLVTDEYPSTLLGFVPR